MVRVRLYGPISLSAADSELLIDAARLDELLARVSERCPAVSVAQLKQAAIFVNGVNITALRLFRTKLKAGDEVQILSPAAGG